MNECFEDVRKFMEDRKNMDNALLYLSLANEYYYYCDEFLSDLESMVCKEPQKMLNSPQFLCLSKDAAEYVLSLDGLQLEEVQIFEAAVRWAKASLERQRIHVQSANICTELKQIATSIRFPIMTAAQFLGILEQYRGLFDPNEDLDILQYIIAKRPLTLAAHFDVNRRVKHE